MATWNTKISNNEDQIFLKLSGRLTEESIYPEIDYKNKKHLEIDLGDIDLLNSIGIQRWIIFFRTIPSAITVSFSRCPTIISNQMIMLPDFVNQRKIEIKSFYAPYYCPSCEHQQDILLDTQNAFSKSSKVLPTDVKCPSCGHIMEFDDIESSFIKMFE